MDENEQPVTQPAPSADRLESWKEIATHLKRGVSTVQRWEKQEGLPIHRHLHNKLGSVWAHRSEIDVWWRERQAQLERQPEPTPPAKDRRRLAAFALGLVLLGGGILWAVLHRSRPTAVSPRPVPLTSLEGREFDPALSPDGKELAFVWDAEGRGEFHLYVMAVGGNVQRRVTQGAGSVCCPAWSPDRQSIALVRLGPAKSTVNLVPAAGGSERELATIDAWFGTGLTWATDGKHIVYPHRAAPTEAYRLLSLSLDTLETRPLTSPDASFAGDAFPSYSPDGKSLAFVRVSATGDALPADVYVAREAAAPRQLTFQGALIGGLDWNQQGRELVYAGVVKGDRARLWRVSASGDTPPTVIDGPEPTEILAETLSVVSHALRLSTSRGSPAIAYVRGAYDTNIWKLAGLAPGRTRPPTRFIASTLPDESPQYSPDGSKIAFASSRSGTPEIWTCLREGTGCLAVTSLGVHSGTPRWSPDGRRIAFDSRRDGQSDIYVLDVESRQARRITTSAAEDVVPSWSADGRFVYFASNRAGPWQIFKTSDDGATVSRITSQGGFAAFEGTDDVYFSKHDAPGLWRVPRSGGEEVLVSDRPLCWGHWALAKEGVYFLDSETGGRTSLAFLRFGSGRATSLGSIEQTAPCAESSIAVSPDGSEMLVVAQEQSSDIMMVQDR